MPLGTRGIAVIAIALAASSPRRVDVEPQLRSGDVVFQTSKSPMSRAIREATHSAFSHTGLVEVAPDGVFVIEAIAPVSRTPFKKWRNRGIERRIQVERVKDLTPEQAQNVIATAKAWLGRPYDLRYAAGDDAIYCSELVYRAFEDGAHKHIGTPQTFESLDLSPRDYKLAQELEVDLATKVITPASIANDPQMGIVATDF